MHVCSVSHAGATNNADAQQPLVNSSSIELYSKLPHPHRCSRTACIHAPIAAAILRRLCWRCKAAAALLSCVEDCQVLMTCLQGKGQSNSHRVLRSTTCPCCVLRAGVLKPRSIAPTPCPQMRTRSIVDSHLTFGQQHAHVAAMPASAAATRLQQLLLLHSAAARAGTARSLRACQRLLACAARPPSSTAAAATVHTRTAKTAKQSRTSGTYATCPGRRHAGKE